VHVPGWHEATRELQEESPLQVVGIIEEQHPDRARLFMQWKGMDWPVLVDPLNLLGVGVVPITVLIDERGVVRRVVPPRSDPRTVLAEFLAEPPPDALEAAAPRTVRGSLGRPPQDASPGAWRAYADNLAHRHWDLGPDLIDRAIAGYERVLALDPGDAAAEFRLGVVWRMRYDDDGGRLEDFRRAVLHWERALALDPNNYIWRRRIQQYGPRLDKPYPFYDWVGEARAAIAARGETPVELRVEPQGAELARPSRSFGPTAEAPAEPDADGQVLRDDGKFVRVQATPVPRRVPPGGVSRVHIEFRTNPENDAHWNNEAGGLVVWIDPPSGWRVDRRHVELPNPPRAESDEVRRVEIEVQAPETPGGVESFELPVYALYYVCETGGPCLYRRQDVTVELERAEAP
jgi:hypothetical protein